MPREHRTLNPLLYEILVDHEADLASGWGKAIIGHTCGPNVRAVYDVQTMLDMLMKDMSEDEAWEFLEYNVFGNRSDNEPIFVYQLSNVRQEENQATQDSARA